MTMYLCTLALGIGIPISAASMLRTFRIPIFAQVLKRIMQHEFAEAYFNEAVDPEALGIPDYFDIIKVRTASDGRCMAIALLVQDGGSRVSRVGSTSTGLPRTALAHGRAPSCTGPTCQHRQMYMSC